VSTPTFYVETSVWGCLAARQPADRKRVVRRLLTLLDGRQGICVISDIVLEEIALATPTEAALILGQIDSVRPVAYSIPERVQALARAYLAAGVLPERRQADGLHVAAATFFGVDYLVSWNHRHMTRPSKRLQYEAVNLLNGHVALLKS
jgi:hypothetical protein